VKVLPTYIFNDYQTDRSYQADSRSEDAIPEPPKINVTASKWTPRRKTPKKPRAKRSAEVKTTTGRSSSRKIATNRSTSFRTRPQSAVSKGKPQVGLNLNKIPNLKYEVEKLLRAVFRHSVSCPEFKEELKKVGGSRLLDEYVKTRQNS